MRIAKSWCLLQKKMVGKKDMSKEKMGKEMGREKKALKEIRCTKQGCFGLPKLAPEGKGCSHWLPL